MLYQVVMDESNGISPAWEIEIWFVPMFILAMIAAFFGGQKAANAVMLVGTILIVAFYVLIRAPWIIIEWGLANSGVFGNIQVGFGSLWICASLFYIVSTAVKIFREGKKTSPNIESSTKA